VVPVIPQQQEIRIIRISPTTRRVLNVIAELSAAMAAIKETAGLAKVINDAKTDAEVKAATIELQNKLITLQAECFSLCDAIRFRDEEIMHLKAKIAETEDFQRQAEGYKLNKLDSGTLVYSKKQFIGDTEITVHLCPQCFGKKVISVLQPMEIMRFDAHFRTFCPACNNKFWMNSR
ncbi:TPA: hypothetical protein ACH9UH_005175, partial [Escherichia coli]